MDRLELAIDTFAVVVLGEFDPLLLTPRWLRQMDLIGAEDYESYRVDIISPNGTAIEFGSIKFNVMPDTLQITTEATADVEAARDLAVGILLSKGTPRISSIGINRMVHFPAGQEEYHAIGDALVPKEQWQGVLLLPGMLNMGICGVREDGYGGSINVQVQPSVAVRPGVFVSVNDHYNLVHADTPPDRNSPADPEVTNPIRSSEKIAIATKVLTEGFRDSRDRAQAIIERVASLSG